jgi:hypothetical protein
VKSLRLVLETVSDKGGKISTPAGTSSGASIATTAKIKRVVRASSSASICLMNGKDMRVIETFKVDDKDRVNVPALKLPASRDSVAVTWQLGDNTPTVSFEHCSEVVKVPLRHRSYPHMLTGTITSRFLRRKDPTATDDGGSLRGPGNPVFHRHQRLTVSGSPQSILTRTQSLGHLPILIGRAACAGSICYSAQARRIFAVQS